MPEFKLWNEHFTFSDGHIHIEILTFAFSDGQIHMVIWTFAFCDGPLHYVKWTFAFSDGRVHIIKWTIAFRNWQQFYVSEQPCSRNAELSHQNFGHVAPWKHKNSQNATRADGSDDIEAYDSNRTPPGPTTLTPPWWPRSDRCAWRLPWHTLSKSMIKIMH